MSIRTKKFAEELDELIKDGDMLSMAMEYECAPDRIRKSYLSIAGKDNESFADFTKNLPDFGSKYQVWYSKAQALIKQVMPDRLADKAYPDGSGGTKCSGQTAAQMIRTKDEQ